MLSQNLKRFKTNIDISKLVSPFFPTNIVFPYKVLFNTFSAPL